MVTLNVRFAAGTDSLWIVGAFKERLLAYFLSATRANSIPRRAPSKHHRPASFEATILPPMTKSKIEA